MSLQDIEFVRTDAEDIKVKEELKFEFENDSEGIDISALDASFVRANNTSYGEAFLVEADRLILICSFCNDIHASMHEFGEHIRDKHLNTVDSIDAFLEVTSKEVKSEDEKDELSEKDEGAVGKVENDTEDNLEDGHDQDDDDFPADSDSDYEPEPDDSEKPETTKKPVKAKRQPGKYFCDKCNRPYKNAKSYNKHVKTVHENKKTPKKRKPILKCRYCDKEFATEEETLEHRNTHDRLRPFQCPHCPKTFTNNKQRQIHINMHLGHRPYKCPQCPSAFAAENNLRQHMLQHDVGGKLSCEICGKKFIQKCHKEMHMRSHTGEKPVQCELCGRKFIKQSRLTDHMKRHLNQRDHECDVCGKRFYTNVHLNHHKVAHSTDRPFACEQCGKTFPRKISLKKHRLVHSEVKQFVCNICGRDFRQYSGLYSHKKSHGLPKGLPQTNIAVSDTYATPSDLLIVNYDEMSNETAAPAVQ